MAPQWLFRSAHCARPNPCCVLVAQRLLTHRTAQHWGLETTSLNHGPDQGKIVAMRTLQTRPPKVGVRVCAREGLGELGGGPLSIVCPSVRARISTCARTHSQPRQRPPAPPCCSQTRLLEVVISPQEGPAVPGPQPTSPNPAPRVLVRKRPDRGSHHSREGGPNDGSTGGPQFR
jgi:hypothetical protein